MKIKINEWQELDGVENDLHKIEMNGYCIILKTSYNEFLVNISTKIKNEIISTFLSAFGFDIEFIEAPKLTEKEWHFVRACDDGWMVKDKNGSRAYWYDKKPEREDGHPYGQWVNVGDDFQCSPLGMFGFIKWESEPWSIADLRKLDKE